MYIIFMHLVDAFIQSNKKKYFFILFFFRKFTKENLNIAFIKIA